MDNTIFSAYNDIKRRLQAAGIEDYGFEARVIIRHITGFDNKKIMLNYNMPLSAAAQSKLGEIIKRRVARCPLQYILGEWSFYGLNFKVGEGVLIPRPDTETVVDTALKLISEKAAPKVLDLCAGSGAIGISIAANRPDSRVYLLEKYEKAANYLKENIKQNMVNNAQYISGDVLKCDGAGQLYDLIVSNPPYIASADMKTLQPEVKYEPEAALDGGEDGLMFYRAITENYKSAIAPGGSICFEVGINEAQSVREILRSAGFSGVETRKDLAGVDRVVFGTVK